MNATNFARLNYPLYNMEILKISFTNNKSIVWLYNLRPHIHLNNKLATEKYPAHWLDTICLDSIRFIPNTNNAFKISFKATYKVMPQNNIESTHKFTIPNILIMCYL